MKENITRRNFLATASVAALATSLVHGADEAPKSKNIKILGVSCSPRKGMTTATAVQAALNAAAKVNPRIQTELIDLGGMNIMGWTGGSKPTDASETKDDFERIRPLLKDFDGIIIGSPSFYRSLSSLAKAFLERCSVFQAPKLAWSDRPAGVLAVGGYRNGGQELVIQQIQTALLCFDMMIVGGKPRAHQGATLWNSSDDDITKDTFGMDTAAKLGARVAEAALRLATKAA